MLSLRIAISRMTLLHTTRESIRGWKRERRCGGGKHDLTEERTICEESP